MDGSGSPLTQGTYVALIDGQGNAKLCILPAGTVTTGTTLIVPTNLQQLSAQQIHLVNSNGQNVNSSATKTDDDPKVTLLSSIAKTPDVNDERLRPHEQDDNIVADRLINPSLELRLELRTSLPVEERDDGNSGCETSGNELGIPVMDDPESNVCGSDVMITESNDAESTVCVSEFSDVMQTGGITKDDIGTVSDTSAVASDDTDATKVAGVESLEQPRVLIVDVMPDVKYSADCIQGGEAAAFSTQHFAQDSDIPNEVAAEETVVVTTPTVGSKQSEMPDISAKQISIIPSSIKLPLNTARWNPLTLDATSSNHQSDSLALTYNTADLMALMQSGGALNAVDSSSSAEDSDFTGLSQLLVQQVGSASQEREPTIRDLNKRERDKQKKRSLRADPAYRKAETVKAQARMKARRTDPEYRERERIRDRMRRRQSRAHNNEVRKQERERDRQYQRQHRLENSVVEKTQVEVVDYTYLMNPIVPEDYS